MNPVRSLEQKKLEKFFLFLITGYNKNNGLSEISSMLVEEINLFFSLHCDSAI